MESSLLTITGALAADIAWQHAPMEQGISIGQNLPFLLRRSILKRIISVTGQDQKELLRNVLSVFKESVKGNILPAWKYVPLDLENLATYWIPIVKFDTYLKIKGF